MPTFYAGFIPANAKIAISSSGYSGDDVGKNVISIISILAKLIEFKHERIEANFGGTVTFYKMSNIGLILLGEVTSKNGQVICSLPSWFKFKNNANTFAGASGTDAVEVSVYPQGIICFGNLLGISASGTFILE